MSQPYFSIVIPCLNEEIALPLLLSDLRDQAYQDFEVVVVDGNSDDATRDVVQQDKHVRLLVSPKRNVAFQRNFGAKQAVGSYLVFLDADTRLPPYFCSGLVYKIMTKNPDMFTCWASVSGEQKENLIIAHFINMGLELGKFLDNPVAIGAMMGFKRSAFVDLKGYDPKITYGEDVELFKRGFKRGYSLEIFKDPRYTLSLRRFQAEGTLSMLRTYAKLNSRMLIRGFPTYKLDNVYPMLGGKLYNNQRHKEGFMAQIEKNLKRVRELTKLRKWGHFWERLLNE